MFNSTIFKFGLTSGAASLLSLTLLVPDARAAEYSAACIATLTEADQLYLAGNTTEAEKLYKQCKPAGASTAATFFPEPIEDAAQLSPAAQVYWREAQEGLDKGQKDRAMVALNLLVKESPEFVPAYGLMASALQDAEDSEEALALLEQAATLFPHDASIANARIVALQSADRPLESSIAARLFAMVNPEHAEVNNFEKIADDDLGRFQGALRSQYLTQTGLGIIGSIFLGGGNALENTLNPQTLQAIQLVVEGESTSGRRFAAEVTADAQANDTLFEDPVVAEYVNKIGQDIAALMGRDEFEYEFSVIEDDAINAFALPGGKVFINTGAIMAANSEAELAGLIAHEVSHAVLSHGYQSLATNSLLSATQNVLPAGGTLLGLVSLGSSRQHEQQSDILGTRAVANAGYAADGLHNFLIALSEETGDRPPEYASTHPAPESRLAYLEALIDQNGYNRFGYEGVARHQEIQQRIQETLAAK
jgi:predicted Zn-dependent protease